MKNQFDKFSVFLALVGMFVFFSCGKDDPKPAPEPEPTFEEQLVGKWMLDSLNTSSGGMRKANECEKRGFLVFGADGAFTNDTYRENSGGDCVVSSASGSFVVKDNNKKIEYSFPGVTDFMEVARFDGTELKVSETFGSFVYKKIP